MLSGHLGGGLGEGPGHQLLEAGDGPEDDELGQRVGELGMRIEQPARLVLCITFPRRSQAQVPEIAAYLRRRLLPSGRSILGRATGVMVDRVWSSARAENALDVA